MSVPNTPYFMPQAAQDSLINYCKMTTESSFNILEMRSRFEYIDKEYIRENQMVVQSLASAGANMAGDKRKIQDAVIPVVEPQVETAHTFLSSVFLTGYPIFGVVSDKNNADAARQMEAVISENATRGGWTREISLFFRDGLKYNFSALEVEWCRKKVWTISSDTAYSKTEGKPKDTIWQGNVIRRRDPYNCFFDPRVPLTEQHIRGEFVGYSELVSRIELTEWMQSLTSRMNVTKALEASSEQQIMTKLFYIPQVYTQNFSFAKLQGVMDWNRWAFGSNTSDIRARFKNLYVRTTRYIRIIPKEFGMQVPQAGQVQIWKIVTVNDQIVVYAERQTNAHSWLPMIFGQPVEDGLNLQTKSLAQKMIPFQDLASALMNSKLAARRRLIADRCLYDPSRIRAEDINSDSPTAKIPVRPNAYGQPLEKAVYQFPFRDDQTVPIMNDVREIRGYSDEVSGQNKAQQGQFVKGNKTKVEYEDVQHNSSGRQRTQAILLEAQVFTPLKEILKLNIMQYQPAGPIYNPVDKKEYNIQPEDLRSKAMVFKVSDGQLPSDKIIEGSTLEIAMQVVGNSEQLASEYNVGDIFAHLMKSRGIDLDQYKYSDQEKQAMQQQKLKEIAATEHAATVGNVSAQQKAAALQPQA